MAHLPFKTVDVFTTVAFKGNPVAVVLDAGGLSARQMQQIAHWTNLSETTFVVPRTVDGADYHVRIFTPGAEMPFAGHPTIGTAHALLEAGMIAPKDGVLVQQCKAGLVRLEVGHAADGARWISFDLPAPTITPLDAGQAGELEAILGSALEQDPAPCLVDVGARWVIAQLASAQAVLDCAPDLPRMRLQDLAGRHTGVVIFGKHGPENRARIEVRAFAPAHGVNEDPVCGSGNGAVAAYIRHTGQAGEFGGEFLASQGQVLGRAGVLRLSIPEGAIRVGGNAVTCIDGSLSC
ncbi:PhzF family phenazine biosynthesis protein [Massilia niastensis]|uniref:PhzF family phenazine biosynthesis protein n=1 Tax=Massilia niastensis TaxID=544911 RepID=UPI00035E3BBE|nr:PhzF family phenazine biosynthesis protein [Massilia niastensis]